MKNSHRILCGNPEGKYNLRDLSTDRNVILK
jgi:hypothetical protein